LTAETEDYDKSATPTAHASTHENEGSDEISIAGLSGEAADEQKSTWAKVSGKPSTYPPDIHASTHEDGGSDEINIEDLAGKSTELKALELKLIDHVNFILPQQKTDFGGTARYQAVAAEAGGKIYVGTGYDGTNHFKDWWEYDPDTDAWTQKTDFGGTARGLAVAAEAGGKIYVGTGYDGANTKDWWYQRYNE